MRSITMDDGDYTGIAGAGARARRWMNSAPVVCSLAFVGYVLMVAAPARAQLSGTVSVDGSSTVAPIMMAAAELFAAEHPRIRVTVGISGTGGGFKKFLDQSQDLRTDINDASRPIKGKEARRAEKIGVEFIEFPIGIDGIAVVVHKKNTFCDSLSVKELKRIWEPGSVIRNWSQIRSGFPDLPLKLYGPGADSGTFDYFTKAIVGEERASRSDYTASESDNVLVQGVAGDPGSLGYFGYSYFEANKARIRAVGIDTGNGKPVVPSLDAIRAGEYLPLSRPLFLYVNTKSYPRPEVKAFLAFVLDNAKMIVEHPRVNYVALGEDVYSADRQRLEKSVTGSVLGGDSPAKDASDLAALYRP